MTYQEITIYYINLEDVTVIINNDLLRLISYTRMEKIKAYNDNEKKELSLYAGLLTRMILEKEYFITFENTQIEHNEFGKPYLLNEGIQFSISHTTKAIVCAFSYHNIGVDIENNKRNNIQKYIKNVNSKFKLNLNVYNFFENWTKIEAYFKCLGEGIRFDNLMVESDKLSFFKIDNYSISIYSKYKHKINFKKIRYEDIKDYFNIR